MTVTGTVTLHGAYILTDDCGGKFVVNDGDGDGEWVVDGWMDGWWVNKEEKTHENIVQAFIYTRKRASFSLSNSFHFVAVVALTHQSPIPILRGYIRLAEFTPQVVWLIILSIVATRLPVDQIQCYPYLPFLNLSSPSLHLLLSS